MQNTISLTRTLHKSAYKATVCNGGTYYAIDGKVYTVISSCWDNGQWIQTLALADNKHSLAYSLQCQYSAIYSNVLVFISVPRNVLVLLAVTLALGVILGVAL